MGRRLGLIIGINQYQDPTFRPLQFAENDAQALAQWLVNAKGGNWASTDVQLAQGTQATRELMESLTAQLCLNIAEPGDALLIYFAGHAFVDEKNGEGYLALANTSYQNSTTGFRLLSFARQILGRSRASHILFVLDCFQTGPAWGIRRSSPFDSKPLLGPMILSELQQQPNRLFLCSCRGNELAPEKGEQHLGTLAHRMIVGLCGPASDPITGNVTLRPLHTYLFKNLGEQHRPQLFGQDQPSLTLVGNESLSPSPTNQPMSSPTGGQQSVDSSNQQRRPTGSQPSMRAASSTVATASPVDQHRQQQCHIMLEQAQQLLQAQNYREAFDLVGQVLQITPYDTTALLLKAQLLGKAGLAQEAFTTTEQLLQIDTNIPLAWSIRAFLLSNLGQNQAALAAIEHSLELDATNPESYAIKTTIMANMAATQGQNGTNSKAQTLLNSSPNKPTSPLLSIALSSGAFLLGTLGSILSILLPSVPSLLALLLISLGLSLLCVNAAREAYRYGFLRFLPTIVLSLISGGLIGVLYKFGYTKIVQEILAHPTRLVPILFLALWLASVAILPLVAGLGGWIGCLVSRRRKGKL